MPFMKGKAPVRRSIQYLSAGRLALKEKIRVFSVNYNTYGDHHEGARDFVFWNIPQIQYKNPSVQVVTFKNMTPSPFIKCYYEDGKQILIDIDSKDRNEIMQHLVKVIGKTQNFKSSSSTNYLVSNHEDWMQLYYETQRNLSKHAMAQLSQMEDNVPLEPVI